MESLMRTPRAAAIAFAISLGFAISSSASKAQTIFVDFNSDACNSGLGCVSPPTTLLAEAAITQVGANVSVNITLNPSATGFAFDQTGNPPILGFMASASNTADAAIGGTSTAMNNLNGGVTWKYDPTGSGYSPPYNGFGLGGVIFNHGVGYEDPANVPFTFPITFTLNDVVLADFVAGKLANGHASPYIMALDLCAGFSAANGSCTGTGFVGGVFSLISHQGGEVPLPAALPLFVSGLGGLGLLGWRRKRKNALARA
jgi:hypothetical protein